MIDIHIESGIDSKGKDCTVILQNGESTLRINVFLDQPFSVSGNKTYVYGQIAQVLTKILLGVQLYNFQNTETQVTMNIYAEFTKEEIASSDYSVTQSIAAHAYKGGHTVVLSEKDTKETSRMVYEKEVFPMKSEYEIKCISFADYVDQKSKNKFSVSRGKALTSRQNAMEFAHPVDSGIIQILDTPAVNGVFSTVVNLATDMDYGLMLSTGIRMDDMSGEVYDALSRCSEILGIPIPYTVVSSSVSGLNACTVGTDGANCIAIGSLLKALMDQGELTFVLGHECGHIALGHVLYHSVMGTVRNAAELIPLVGHAIYQMVAWPLMAWHRRSEISADRAGLLCCGDINVACRALLKLECGFMNIDELNVEEYVMNTNQQLSHSLLGRYQELLHEHPILAKRIEALKLFAQSEKYYRLSGLPVPKGVRLLSDSELDRRTEKIIQIMD